MISITDRRTVVAQDYLAVREIRLDAARRRNHGLQVMTVEQLAVRLAGGFAKPIDGESLRIAIQTVLPSTQLGELNSIRLLPGMVEAAASTMQKAWRAGIDIASRAGEHPRLGSIACLEAAVMAQLPPGMLRPGDLVSAACMRLEHAKSILGPVEVVGISELPPCWRPLLQALAEYTTVTWSAGPRPIPGWIASTGISIARSLPKTPTVSTVSAATAYHESIEAIRWARQLLASGQAEPGEIAIAATSTAEYDDHFLSLRADANIGLHFVHGIKVVASRDGQTAAALADILVRGLSQTRIRRLATLCGSRSGFFQTLPAGWVRILPADAPLTSEAAWIRLLERLTSADWPDQKDHSATLRGIIELLAKGHSGAKESGNALLSGRALTIWQKALASGPSGSLDTTLGALKQDDGLEASVSVAWMPAGALAASPRRFVRLLGLNSSRWPRNASEDRLISDHIIPTVELDPLPIDAKDRLDFDTILATTEHEVVLSRSRRDTEGRLLGSSQLLNAHGEARYISRNATPVHAFSETDRLTARPQDFALELQATSAINCWRDWQSMEITPHDGLVVADHPLVLKALNRVQSATSLRLLLRNPLGFIWRYGLRLQLPETGTEPLVLNPLAMGSLVHAILDHALRKLEAGDGLATADEVSVKTAVQQATAEVSSDWESTVAVPPAIIWRRTLDEASLLTSRALFFGRGQLENSRSFGEVAFGGAKPKVAVSQPWDSNTKVEIPDTGFRIAGYIDRLDISDDGRRALVQDYKTGRAPKNNFDLNGGRELQRCLYAFAVKAMLGEKVDIAASLFYPRDEVDLRLEDPAVTLQEITGHLQKADTNFRAGLCLVGPDTGGQYDDFAFALPANAGAVYCKRKLPAATVKFGDAAKVWEAK